MPSTTTLQQLLCMDHHPRTISMLLPHGTPLLRFTAPDVLNSFILVSKLAFGSIWKLTYDFASPHHTTSITTIMEDLSAAPIWTNLCLLPNYSVVVTFATPFHFHPSYSNCNSFDPLQQQYLCLENNFMSISPPPTASQI